MVVKMQMSGHHPCPTELKYWGRMKLNNYSQMILMYSNLGEIVTTDFSHLILMQILIQWVWGKIQHTVILTRTYLMTLLQHFK